MQSIPTKTFAAIFQGCSFLLLSLFSPLLPADDWGSVFDWYEDIWGKWWERGGGNFHYQDALGHSGGWDLVLADGRIGSLSVWAGPGPYINSPDEMQGMLAFARPQADGQSGDPVAVGKQGRIFAFINFPGEGWVERESGVTRHLRAAAYSRYGYVAVGDGGTVVTSVDGMEWAVQDSGVEASLFDVVWSNSRYFAVGDDGVILSSRYGIHWERHPSGTSDRLYGIASNGERFVAVTWGGSILSSVDGREWSTWKPDMPVPLYSVAAAPLAGFMAVGASGVALYSPNGMDWRYEMINDEVIGDVFPLVSVRWDPSQGWFTAVGASEEVLFREPIPRVNIFANEGGVVSEGDLRFAPLIGSHVHGVFEAHALITPDEGYEVAEVSGCPGMLENGRFVVSNIWEECTLEVRFAPVEAGLSLPDQDIASDFDIWEFDAQKWRDWQPVPPPKAFDIRRVESVNGRLFAFGAHGDFSFSVDGSHWSASISGNASNLRDVAFGNGRWVMVGDGGTLLTSQDAESWSAVDIGSEKDLHALAWSPPLGLFVAAGEAGTILTSGDGRVWSVGDVPEAGRIDDVIWSDNRQLFFGVGEGGRLWSSANGAAWASVELEEGVSIIGLVEDSARLLAIGANGWVWSSDDAHAWQVHPQAIPMAPVAVVRNDATSQFVALGERSAVYVSDDGLEWRVRRAANIPHVDEYDDGMPYDMKQSDLAWGGEQAGYIAVGSGRIYQSMDGRAWIARQEPVYQPISSWLDEVTWVDALELFVVVGDSGLVLTSADGENWFRSPFASSEDLVGVVWGEGRLVAVGELGGVFGSPDGYRWEQLTRLDDVDWFYENGIDGVGWVRGRYFTSGMLQCTSIDALNWECVDGYLTSFYLPVWDGSRMIYPEVSADMGSYVAASGKWWFPLESDSFYSTGEYNVTLREPARDLLDHVGPPMLLGDWLVLSYDDLSLSMHEAPPGARDVTQAGEHGAFYMVGASSKYGGQIFSSTDGLSWEKEFTYGEYNLESIAWSEPLGKLVAAGGRSLLTKSLY